MASLTASAGSLPGALRGLLATAAGAAACCGPLLAAGAADGAPATLHLSVVVAFKHVNANGSYELREKVYTGAEQTGEGSTRCSKPSQGRRLCSGAFTLEPGQIDFAGSISDSTSTTRLAITGGEGRYHRARGTVVSVFSRGGTHVAATISFH